MAPPFTPDQFLDAFRRYNLEVWPAQYVLLAIGLLAMFAVYRASLKGAWNWGRASLMLTALLWLWAGIEYHFRFFADVTPAAKLFGNFFIAEAMILALCAWQPEPMFTPVIRPGIAVGAVLMLYTLAGYPLLNYAVGHRYPAVPTFGVPCPVTMFTFALFCLIPSMIPRAALVIPLLWAAMASSSAFALGILADLGLVVCAGAALWMVHYAHVRIARARPLLRPRAL